MKKERLLKKLCGVLVAICGLWIFSACGSSTAAVAPAGGGERAPRPGAGSGAKPSWTRDVYQKYNKATDIAALGVGTSNAQAEKDAFGKLIAQFGTSIMVDERIAVSYSEAISKGITTSYENTSIDNTIVSSTSMDSLVGADIGDRWDDGKNFYAVAVMNKANAAKIYKEKIETNQGLIEKVIDMPAAQKNSLDGFARYQFAATLADINVSYGNLLQVIGAPTQGLKKGDDYRLLAKDLTKNIPIGVVVTCSNDVYKARIESAFRDVVASLGFQSGGNNARYVISVTASTQEAKFAGQQPNITYSRIDIVARLSDNTTKNVLVPYNFDERLGGGNMQQADQAVYTAAQEKIRNEFKNTLNDYLSQLLPSR